MLWRAWVLLIAGLWTLLAPFVLHASQAQTYSDVIAGVVVAALAIWTLLAGQGEAKSEEVRKAA